MFTGTNPIIISIKLITHRISLASHFYHNDSTWCRNAHWTFLWQFAPLHHLTTALKRHLNSQSCLSTLYGLIEWKFTSCAAQITFQILIWMNSRWKRHHRRICSTRRTDFLRHVQHWGPHPKTHFKFFPCCTIHKWVVLSAGCSDLNSEKCSVFTRTKRTILTNNIKIIENSLWSNLFRICAD